jgi:hypothetical protein
MYLSPNAGLKSSHTAKIERLKGFKYYNIYM